MDENKIDRFLDWCAMACAHYPIVWLMMLPILVPIVGYQLVRNLINYYRRK